MEAYKNVYSNGEVIVTYEPSRCIHAEACAKGLSSVFKTSVIPWIDLDGASSKKIIAQVKKCPSGALSCTKVKSRSFVKDIVI
ncbi:MAG: (4Fe-4S)-binding protein [Aequorivita sp.]|nr:(4Fe-4S)-binding protein [Aequorivita sp.]